MSFHGPSFLLPQNRKLRHLRGLYLRNLTLTRPHGTIDDRDTLQSAEGSGRGDGLDRRSTKACETGETDKSGIDKDTHTNKSDDSKVPLASPTLLPQSQPNDSHDENHENGENGERGRGRRVTLSSATANARQRILEQALDSYTADAFFSLHHEGCVEPVYVSEVAEKAANFNFRSFDFSDAHPLISRSPQLTVKLWVRRAGVWSLLLDDAVDLRCLDYVGSSLLGAKNGRGPAAHGDLPTLATPAHYPSNCLIFHLVDGLYMYGTGDAENGGSGSLPSRKTTPQLPTVSYSSLMRLANLENSLQDCLSTCDRLAAQIDGVLQNATVMDDNNNNDDKGSVPADCSDCLADTQARIRRVLRGTARQRRGAEIVRQKRDDLDRSLRARRAAIAEGRDLQQRAMVDVKHATHKLEVSRTTSQRTSDEIRGQRRRICEDLIRIFAIEPTTEAVANRLQMQLPPPPLAFQICGMPLPNTDYGTVLSGGDAAGGGRSGSGSRFWLGGGGGGVGAAPEDVLSAALGYVALLTQALQSYLTVVLPYSVRPHGSRSAIRDDISKIPDAQREFPLYMPRGGLGAQYYRFDYAWFLLNKNIETLCSAQGFKVVDIRHTLPNLKYLLYVCAASDGGGGGNSGSLPARKRGGIRGLGLYRPHVPSASPSVPVAAPQGGDDNDSGSMSLASSLDSSASNFSKQQLLPQPQPPQPPQPHRGSLLRPDTATLMDEAAAAGNSLSLPFSGGDKVLTLRTKGMRENVDR